MYKVFFCDDTIKLCTVRHFYFIYSATIRMMRALLVHRGKDTMKYDKTSRFDYNLIKVMNEVIISGSLSRAAENLDLSVSAVSLSISKLKRSLGSDLFIRTAQGLKPTQIALDIHESFAQAICIIDDVVHTAQYPGEPSPILRVMCSDLMEGYYFQRSCPLDDFSETFFVFTNSIVFDHNECVMSLLNSCNDMILSNAPIKHTHITALVIDIESEFVAICGNSSLLASQKDFTLSHYYTLPHAVYCSSDEFGRKPVFTNNIHVTNEFTGLVKVTYHSSSINGVISVVERSDMVSILPRKIAEYFVHERSCKLAIFPLPEEIHCEELITYANFYTRTPKYSRVNKIINCLKEFETY